MSLQIKVQFEGQIYILEKGITSISDINIQMKKRCLLQLPPLEYFFEGIIVDDLSLLLTAMEDKGKTTLRLQARPATNKTYNLIEIQPIQIKIPQKKFNDQSIAEVIDNFTHTFSTNYNIPQQFYTCFNCEGKGVYEDKDNFQWVCETCNGKGEFKDDHKYIIHIKKLLEKYINFEKRQQKPKKQQFQRIFRQINQIFDLSINEIHKIDQVQIGKQFMHEFQIQNNGPDLPEMLELVDCETMQSTPVNSLRSGEKSVLCLGPFTCHNEEMLRKSYHLCYRQGNGWVRIGHRFGFRIRGFKKKSTKKVQEATQQLIKDLKMLSGSNKSQKYLASKLKEMGIDLNNIEMEDEILIDIIKGID